MAGYRAWLIGRGYSPSVVVRSLVTLGHLGRWLARNALAVDQLTAEAVTCFLAEYRVDRGRLPGASVWPLISAPKFRYFTRLTVRIWPRRFTLKRMEPDVLTIRVRRSARYVSR